MQRIDATQYGNEAALHALGAISLFEVRDPKTNALVSYDVAPDVDLKGYDAAAAEASKPPVPASVSKAQAKIQLLRTPGSALGKTLLDDVTAAVQAASGEVAIWFADAQAWERSNPYVASLSKTLKLTSAQVDELFVEAAKIAA
ncbi:hypothetical protein ACQKQD_18645 [Methylobacterium sp. NPDC080182]|uniref:hypothetical protein n=1 Tax=Methylobacterium sp. NPDC080182 TaxID=3390590 RepID=UPI003CFF9DB9